MRALAVLLAAGLLPSLLNAEPPCGKGNRKDEACAPEVGKPLVTVDAAGNILVIVSTQLLGSPDSARLTVTGPNTISRKLTANRVDTASFAQPANPGDRISGVIGVTAYKGGAAIPALSQTWEWVQPGAAFTFQVKPASFTVQAGKTVRLTATGT